MADGHIVFQGDAKASTPYFASIGYQCPNFANPADFFMKILTVNYPKQSKDEEKVQFLTDNYETFLSG